jgi:tetratricopeptide (TPR) repeat protein
MDLSEWKEVSRRAVSSAARGRYKEARQLLQIALDFAERTNNPIVLGVSLNNLAVLASQAGHYEASLELMERARALPIAVGEPSGLVSCLDSNAGVNHHRQGKLMEARPFYLSSVSDSYAPHRFADPRVVSLTNFALLQLEQGRLTQAESLLKRARQQIDKLPVRDRALEAHVKYAVAQLSLASGRLVKAETEFAELSATTGFDPVITALAQVGQARVMHQQFVKLAGFDSPDIAKSKLVLATALMGDALRTLLELRGAGSLEYLEAALAYVEHLCACDQAKEAELWVQRLQPWMDRLSRGLHPWTIRLLEHHERLLRQMMRLSEADTIGARIVELRLAAKNSMQSEDEEAVNYG